MNKSRFYEILLAHKKGEDLSVFVPTNAPEARLLADLQGGGGSVTVGYEESNAIPNDGTYVETVHFNTDLSVEEVVKILENIEDWYEEDGLFIYPLIVSPDASKIIMIQKNVIDSVAHYIIFSMDAAAEQEIAVFGTTGLEFTGWNPDLTPFEFNNNTVNILMGLSIGTENEKLAEAFNLGEVTTVEKKLQGTYDGSAYVYEVPKLGEPTTVPNTVGYYDKIYVNTSLTDDEIVDMCKYLWEHLIGTGDQSTKGSKAITLTRSYDSETDTYGNMKNTLGVEYEYDDLNGIPKISIGFSDTVTNSVLTLWCNYEREDSTFIGWNPSIPKNTSYYLVIDGYIDDELMETFNNTIGSDNDKFTNLFSMTPFMHDELAIDVEQLLNGGKLPLKIIVKFVESSASYGTTVPNNGFIESVYFNTNLTPEEVNELVIPLCINSGNNLDAIYLLLTSSKSKLMMVQCDYSETTDTVYSVTIAEYVSGTRYYHYDFTDEANQEENGWCIDGLPIAINEEVIAGDEGTSVGEYNETLTKLFSITPFK